jgi:inosine-uridine nucleoside N-ribohydrolase
MTAEDSGRIPLILDVDTGIDDAVAIALALADPRADVVAITTLSGNIHVDMATANTLRVLRFLGADHIPVHRGASKPLVRDLRDAQYFHGRDGLGEPDLEHFDRPLGTDRGPAAIIRLARERPGELTLVCQGPLTNLAIALNVAPELPRLLKSIVVMGGAFKVAGNTTSHAEFNIFADPEAAIEVFNNRALNLTVIGLDVTHQVAIPRETWEAGADSDSRAAQLLAKLCAWVWKGHKREAMFLHDPLAVAVAIDPSLVVCAEKAISVSCDEGNRGETKADRTGRINVAESVDVERFLSLFSSLLGLGSIPPNATDLKPM